MNGIVYDARRILAFESFMQLGEYAGRERSWLDELWADLVVDTALLQEFMYYIDHHTLKDEVKCHGYSLTDLYVWQMSRYNLHRDIGKNTSACNKESMVLGAFRTMLDMQKEPDVFLKRLNDGRGMDQI